MPWWGIVLIILGVLCLLICIAGWLLVDFAINKRSKLFMDNLIKIKHLEKTIEKPGSYPKLEKAYDDYPLEERIKLMRDEMDLDDDHKIFWTKSAKGEKLRAYYYEAPQPTHKYIILVHGYGNSAAIVSRMYKAPTAMRDRGYNLLLPDLLNHGQSEGKFIGMGYLDKFTVMSWIDYIIKMDPEASIALMGVSMGAATVMVTSGEDLPANVKCVVEDCGFTNAYEQFSFVTKNMGLPAGPIVGLLELFAKLRAGYSFKKDASPIDCIKHTKLPFFFVHGENDDFVPTFMMQPLYDACPTEKEKLIIPDADHARSVKYHPELYWPPVWKFIEKYI